MPRRNKAGVDWPEIQRGYMAGMSMRELGRRHGVSHEAIRQRVKKEGWQVDKRVGKLPRVIRNTETAKAFAAPATKGERRQVTLGKTTPENAAQILAKVKQGFTPTKAAGSVGIRPEVLRDWRQRDLEFDALLISAKNQTAGEVETAIRDQAMRGDSRAGERWLAAQETESGVDPRRSANVSNVIVNFSISRDDPPPEVIDGEATVV